MVPIFIAAMLFAPPQEGDISSWIERLGHESIEVREKATHHLQGLKLTEIGPLQQAMERSSSAEIRARLARILEHHKKAAELAKVFGPAIRYTKSGKNLKLADVLRELAALAGLTPEIESVDPDKTIDFDFTNATWWEAMDRCAQAAGLRYTIGKVRKEERRVRWETARGPTGPVLYLEQFRISILDVRRFDLRTLDGPSEIGLVTVCALHQPGLRPVRSGLSDGVQVFVKDAKGDDAKTDKPDRIEGMSWQSSYDLAHYGYSWVLSKAPGPLTVSGTASILFAKDPQVITVDLDGDTGECRRGVTTYRITKFTQSKAQSKLTVNAKSEETIELFERMVENSLVVVDAEGGRHVGRMRFSGRTVDDSTEWEFEFRVLIKTPKKVEFRWIAEFHTVDLPFSFEGVRLP